MELWTSVVSSPKRFPELAQQAEALGWDGVTTVDSQNLASDPYICLALAAQATERLGVMTSVTNAATRVPAATATAALTIQNLSGGRMVLGIGRGDSALAHLGRAPARLKWFELYLASLQAYLRGEAVDFAWTGIPDEVAPTVDSLGLADAPTASAIAWADRVAKVPVEVASTGARVIGIAARHADRIMFALGAEPHRIAWGIETARKAATEAGRDPQTLKFGAYVNLVCHDDVNVGRALGRAGTSLFARFSVMHGSVSGPATAKQQAVFHNVHDRYDMNKHAQSDGNQASALTDEFIDSFAIIGGADHCADRLAALVDLGIDKFSITGPGLRVGSDEAQTAAMNFVEGVMPALRERAGAVARES